LIVEQPMASRMHLPSLTVEGFRGVRTLELPSLGRVTLLAGKNSVGKTTILEAIRVYASRGDSRILLDLLRDREEFVSGDGDEGETIDFPDVASLFHDEDPDDDSEAPATIRIAAVPARHGLALDLVETHASDLLGADIVTQDLRVSVGEHSRKIPVDTFSRMLTRSPQGLLSRVIEPGKPDVWPRPIFLESLGPGLLGNAKVSELWDEAALTPAEEIVTDALKLVVGGKIERIAIVGDRSTYRSRGRRAVAKVSDSSVPIPLKRLGDGAQRLFGISLALANCQDGMLLIDEVENGIHHSILPDLWRMIFRAAERGNVQVVAATHSWDCIASFAVAAREVPADGVLYRLERFGDDLHAVRYSEEDLEVAAQQRIEVR